MDSAPRSRLGTLQAQRESEVPKSNALDWRLVVGFWASVSVFLVGLALLKAGGIPYFGDDALRMVTATEFLHGQGWQDLGLYRDNAPYGTTMHWSRLIDAPVAALMALATPLVGPTAAGDVAAAIWPTLLLLGVLALSAGIIRRLVPDSDAVTALALPVVSVVLLVEFLPGRIDHHNAQILLSLLTLFALLAARDRPWGAIVAGLSCATGLAIGMESLPLVAMTIAIYVLLWLFEPQRFSRPLTHFGLTIASASLGHFLLATAPANYAVAYCDMLSITYVVPALIGGTALAMTARLASDRVGLPLRAGALLVGGATTLASVALFFPECLAGPYAMADALIQTPGYFETISEARSIGTTFSEDPAGGLVYTATVLIAVPLTIWAAASATGERRIGWIIVLTFLVITAFVMLLQIRGTRLATPFALPAGAWLLAKVRASYLRKSGVAQAGLLVGSWLLVSGAAYYAGAVAFYMVTAPKPAVAGAFEPTERMLRHCTHRDTYASLAALPRGRVMAPFQMGPHILLFSPHDTISAGFHRNREGTWDAIAFFNNGEVDARRIADDRSVDYVVFCLGSDNEFGRIGPTNDSHWNWLTPLSRPDEPLQIYRIER